MIEYNVIDGFAELRLNAPPVNALTLETLDRLRAAVERGNEDGAVRGFVLFGGKDHFSAGVDLRLFEQLETPDDAVRLSRAFQDAFNAVEASGKPVAVLMAGKMMGGALELAMACHLRLCVPGTRFSMPEVNLGINPGAGGTQRLPRLVGVETALRMMVNAETLRAEEAMERGLVDGIHAFEQLKPTARELLRGDRFGRRTRDRDGKILDTEVTARALARARDENGRLKRIASMKVIEAVEAGLNDSFQTGLRREQEGFAECMRTPATRNKIYSFFAVRSAGKALTTGGAESVPVRRPAVVGAGTMGTGIVQALITSGLHVLVYDENAGALDRCRDRIRKSLEKRAGQGKLDATRIEEMMGRIAPVSAWTELGEADLVIESVIEDPGIKRNVLKELESVCAARTVIASNTSTLSLDRLAAGMKHPDRLVGLHFFNPAHAMPLVEVIRRDATPAGIVATALAFARSLGKTPVLVRNREGFLVNRLFIPYLKEAFLLLEDGAEAEAVDRAMTDFGFPMGPLTLIDMAGLDILDATDAVMRAAFPCHRPASALLARLVGTGRLGQKTGAGVYRYEKGRYDPLPDEETRRIVDALQRETGRAARSAGADEITDRLVLRMVAEASRVMAEQLVSRESDIDAAMVLGTGFPDVRGGIVKYARDRGLASVAKRLEDLARTFGERFEVREPLHKLEGA